MITSLGLKAKNRAKEIQKSRYAIIKVSKKDLSKIVREFEKSPSESYDRKRPKHEHTDSYFYLAIQLAKCMTRSDALNLHVYPVITEMNGTQQILTSHVYSMDESELRNFPVDKTLLQICSIDEDKSKSIIADECSTNDDESECVHKNINKQKAEKRGRV